VTEAPVALAAAPPRRRRAEQLRPLALPLAAYAASRVLTTLAIAFSAFTQHKSLHRIMTVWDGRWYEKIAHQGYPRWVAHGDFYRGTGRTVQSAVAFFPLYPGIVRVADFLLPGSAWVAGVVVALLLGAVATVLVWVIANRVAGRQVADRAAILFAFSPGAFVLSLVYAEALMVVLAAACLLALMDRRWLLAGVLAALATATRPNAMALGVACAFAAGVAWRQHRDWRALIAPVLTPVGMVAFMLFLWQHTSEPLIWFRVEATGWGERVDFGWSNATTFLRMLSNPNQAVLAVSLVFTLVLIYVLVRARLPGVLNAYAGAALFLVLTSHINARPRFLFVAFPLVIALAKYVKRSTTFTVLVASFATSTVGLTIFYGLQTKNYYP
jgi:hypothetical protein